MADMSDHMVPYAYNADGVTMDKRNSRPEPDAFRNGVWLYFQFQYRNGEAVVVQDAEGKQYSFYVTPNGQLQRMNHNCTVTKHSSVSTQGYFDMMVNGKTIIRMRIHRDGICRGSKDHYKGAWTPLSKVHMQMAVNALSFPAPAPPGPFRPWAPQPGHPVADAYANPRTNPLGLSKHPSGLPEHDLEPCKACDHMQGACYECYNTGMVPKNSSKGTDIMNTAEMIAVIQIQQGAKIVSASYVSNGQAATPPGMEQRVYHFKNVAALPLAKGDLIVVQTREGYSLATVVDPDLRANACECPLGQLKHVVNRVDLEALNTVLEGENNAMHALALSEVTERMNKFKAQIGDDTFTSMAALLAPPTNKE